MATTTVLLEKEIIAKAKSHAFGKDVYLLGEDKDGIKYWLEAAKWDCGWYWGFGYVETYKGNRTPSAAKDIDSHSHVDGSLMGKIEFYNSDKQKWDSEYINNIFDCPTFSKTTFTEKEGWVLSELFKSFYTLKVTAEFYHTGGAHITTNPLRDKLKNEAEENRINKELLPAIFEEIYKILNP